MCSITMKILIPEPEDCVFKCLVLLDQLYEATRGLIYEHIEPRDKLLPGNI